MSARYRIEDDRNGLIIVFRPRWHWLAIAVPAFISIVFFIVRPGSQPMPFEQPAIEKTLAVIMNRLAPFVLAGFAVAAFLWMSLGYEKVLMDGTSIVITQASLGIGRAREFTWSSVRNLRVRSKPDLISLNPGSVEDIAFDYGSRTYSFGAGIGVQEGAELMDRIRRRFHVA